MIYKCKHCNDVFSKPLVTCSTCGSNKIIGMPYSQFKCNVYKYPLDINVMNNELKRLIVLKKILRSFLRHGNLNERLSINMIIIMLNLFGVIGANVILFKELPTEFHDIIRQILIFLNSYSPKVHGFYHGSEKENVVIKNLLQDL